MFVPLEGAKPIPFSETGLIASAVSSGNVGTLACDILILNNDFEKIGYVSSKFIEPVVGVIHDVQKSHIKTLSLPIEVYQNKTTTLIQFRSTVKEGRVDDFLVEIANFLQSCKFKSVILLSSISISARPDKEILSSEKGVYFIENKEFEELNAGGKIINKAGLTPIETLLSENLPDIKVKKASEKKKSIEFFVKVTDLLAGSGLTFRFLKKKQFKGIPMGSLLIFSGEGSDYLASLYESRALSRVLNKAHTDLVSIEFDEKDPFKSIKNKLPSYFNRL